MLDLTYNHLGDAGAKLLSAQLIGPVLKQNNLRYTRPGLWLMEDIKIHVKLMMHIYDFWLHLLSPPCFRMEPAGAQWSAEKKVSSSAALQRVEGRCVTRSFSPSDRCELTLDANTLNRKLQLLDDSRTVR